MSHKTVLTLAFCLAFATSVLAQEHEIFSDRTRVVAEGDTQAVNLDGGAVVPDRPLEIRIQTSKANWDGYTLSAVYSTDLWHTEKSVPFRLSRRGVGPQRRNLEWVAQVDALWTYGPVEFYVMADKPGHPKVYASLSPGTGYRMRALSEIEFSDPRLTVAGQPVRLGAGVAPPNQELEFRIRSTGVADGYAAEAVYSTNDWWSQETRPLTPRAGSPMEWIGTLGPFSQDGFVEYYVTARKPGKPPLFYTLANPGEAPQNFKFAVFGGSLLPAPAKPGELVRIPMEELRGSQPWLRLDRGAYSETLRYNVQERRIALPGEPGERMIPDVYWVNWHSKPHWVLGNDGHHRAFDAWRQGRQAILARVVEVPEVIHRTFPILDAFVFAPGANIRRDIPIGKARDFFGQFPRVVNDALVGPLKGLPAAPADLGNPWRREMAGAGKFAAAYLLKEAFKGRNALADLKTPGFWGSLAVFTVAARGAEKFLPFKGVLPLAAGMAAVQLLSGNFSPRDLAISTGSFLAAGAAMNFLADGMLYPMLFRAGPPGWIAAGAYTVGKLAVTLYAGEQLEAWLREMLRTRSSEEGKEGVVNEIQRLGGDQ